MDVKVKTEIEHSRKGIGPYLVITVALDHNEVPTTDTDNGWAEEVMDRIWGIASFPDFLKLNLTGIYEKLTPEMRKQDEGYGVVVVTHMPAIGTGVPYSMVTAGQAGTVGVGVGPAPTAHD